MMLYMPTIRRDHDDPARYDAFAALSSQNILAALTGPPRDFATLYPGRLPTRPAVSSDALCRRR
jgi:hypothetical protein